MPEFPLLKSQSGQVEWNGGSSHYFQEGTDFSRDVSRTNFLLIGSVSTPYSRLYLQYLIPARLLPMCFKKQKRHWMYPR
jgi:hypothetical protein